VANPMQQTMPPEIDRNWSSKIWRFKNLKGGTKTQ